MICKRLRFLTVFGAALVFTMLGCTSKIQSTTSSYLALGDSYTIGTAIGEDSSYAAKLCLYLKGDKEDEQFDFKVIAKNGWTTTDLIGGMDAASFNRDFDVVSLLIGVNNQYQGLSKNIYRKEFRELLKRAIGLAKNNNDSVFVLSIPDYGVCPVSIENKDAIAKDIDVFNLINREVSDSMEVRYVEITELSRTALNQPDMVAKDGLHFSAGMQQKWFEKVKKELNL